MGGCLLIIVIFCCTLSATDIDDGSKKRSLSVVVPKNYWDEEEKEKEERRKKKFGLRGSTAKGAKGSPKSSAIAFKGVDKSKFPEPSRYSDRQKELELKKKPANLNDHVRRIGLYGHLPPS